MNYRAVSNCVYRFTSNPNGCAGAMLFAMYRYPVIYVLTWIIPLINGIYTIVVGQSSASFSLVLLATVTSRQQVGHFEGLLVLCLNLAGMASCVGYEQIAGARPVVRSRRFARKVVLNPS